MKVWHRFVFISALVTGMVSATFCQESVVRRRVGRDYRSGDVYVLTVESDGAFRLGFAPGYESELADCLEQLIQDQKLSQLEFSKETDPDRLHVLEELMHDRNYMIRRRISPDKLGWEFIRNKHRLQIFIHEEATERLRRSRGPGTVRRRRDGKPVRMVTVRSTRIGGHIQAGKLQEVGEEVLQITLHFDEDGKARLQNFISQESGLKLSLIAEGVTVGEGQVPLEGDGASLTFTLLPDKLKRLDHALQMSKLTVHTDGSGRFVFPRLSEDDRTSSGCEISGRVLYAETKKPAVGIRVGAQGVSPTRGGAKAVSDSEGRYRLRNLRPGTYNVSVKLGGKPPEWTVVAYDSISVRAGETLTGKDLHLIEGIMVSGRVTDIETKKPLEGVQVACYSRARPRSGGWCEATSTNAEGRYVFRLPLGQAYIYIQYRGAPSKEITLEKGKKYDKIDFSFSEEDIVK